MSARADGRRADGLRPISIEGDWLEQPHGSVLWVQGKTTVLCTAMIQEEVPRWLRNQGRGWITAEYSLLPASTGERSEREASRGKQGGRTIEIQRLIGRALRGVVDFQALGERTVWLDCDVLQADGGTRTASITGAYLAARLAVQKLLDEKRLAENPIADSIAAVSVGLFGGRELLDLNYVEDKDAEVDANVVMTGRGQFVEVQSSGEETTFSPEQLQSLLALAQTGLKELATIQTAFITKQLLKS